MSHTVKLAIFMVLAFLVVIGLRIVAGMLLLFLPVWLVLITLLIAILLSIYVTNERTQYFFCAVLAWGFIYPVSDGVSGSFPIWSAIFTIVFVVIAVFSIDSMLRTTNS